MMKKTDQKQRRSFLITNIGIIIMLILMATSSVIFAQPRGGQQGPPPIPNNKEIKTMVSGLADNLSLSEVQRSEVLSIYQKHFANIKKVTSSGRPDRSKMEALKTEMENKVKAVLTEKQQEQFAEYLKNQEKQQRSRR